MPVVPKPHVAARVLERLLGTRAKVLAWEQIGASRAVQSRLFDVVVEESGIDSSAQIGLVLNRVHFAALQILHHDCTVLAFDCFGFPPLSEHALGKINLSPPDAV